MNPTTEQLTYRYGAVRRIGVGGMGAVYEAHDWLTEQRVALKQIIAPQETLAFASLAGTQNAQLALAQEFRILASLRHPNIISVLDYGFDNAGQPFYTMELLTESDDLLRYGAGLSLVERVQLLIDMLRALMYLHRRQIVHRDLKPSNVLVDAERTVRVLDFGLSQKVGAANDLAGTMAYLAPELLRGEPLTLAADLYAVGVIAHQLLSGDHPFAPAEDSQLIIRVLNDPPQTLPDSVPLAVQTVVQRLLAKDPADRYRSAEDVIVAFSRAIDVAVPPETHAQRESFIQAAQFVGRERERQHLLDTLAQIITPDDPQGGMILIGGESGVGKSRLLDELRTQALVSGATVLTGQAREGADAPYDVWHEVVKALILMTDTQPDELSIFQALYGNLQRFADAPIPDLLPNANIQTLFDTYLGVLIERQTAPLLILLEDLHWADESLDALATLVQRHHPRLLIVGTYRNDEAPALPERLPSADVLALERLSDDEIQELSASILGDVGKQQQVLDVIQTETQGNTFFIVEVIRTLADNAGSLSNIGAVTLDKHIFTEGMQQVLERRLNRVPAHYQSLLNLAALQGRLLDVAVLEQLHGSAIDDFLYACAAAAVVDVRDDQWRFAHDKLREALLARLDTDETPALHRRLAEAIEAVHPDDEAYTAPLAEHWRAARDPRRESPYVLQAARRAFDNSFFAEAQQWLQRAITIEAWQYTAQPAHTHAEILRKLGSAAYQFSDYDAAVAYHQQARAALEGHDAPEMLANIVGSLGDIYALIGRFDEAEYTLNEALTYAEQSGDPERLGIVYMNIGSFNAQRGNDAIATQQIRQSYDYLRQTDNQVEIAKALNNVALSYQFLDNDHEKALATHEEVLQLRRNLNDQHGVISSAVNIANIHIKETGNLNRAETLLQEAQRIAEQLALVKEHIRVENHTAQLATARDDVDAARQHLDTALTLARRSGNPLAIGQQLFSLGEFAYQQGDYVIAGIHWLESVQVREVHGHTGALDNTIGYIGRLLHTQGQSEVALSLLAYTHAADAFNPSNDDLRDLYAQLQADLPADTVEEILAAAQYMSRDEVIARVETLISE